MSPSNKSLSAVSYVSLPASEGAAVDERRQNVASGEPAHEISTVANSFARLATASTIQCTDSRSTDVEMNGEYTIQQKVRDENMENEAVKLGATVAGLKRAAQEEQSAQSPMATATLFLSPSHDTYASIPQKKLRGLCSSSAHESEVSAKPPLLPTLPRGCGHQQQSENNVMLLRQRQCFAYASSDKVKSYIKPLENDLPLLDLCDIDNFEVNLSNTPESSHVDACALGSDPLDNPYDCCPTDDTEANLNGLPALDVCDIDNFEAILSNTPESADIKTVPLDTTGALRSDPLDDQSESSLRDIFAPNEGNTDTEVLQEGFDNSHSHDLSVNSLLAEDFDNDDFGANLNEERLFWYMNIVKPYMDKLSGCENSSITNHTFEENLDRDDSLPNGVEDNRPNVIRMDVDEPSGDAKPARVDRRAAIAAAARPPRTYIKENDIIAKKDIVCGQGNDHPGMRQWCDLCDKVRKDIDEFNSKARATEIVDSISNKGGRFIGREFKPSKLYVMSKEEAVHLTEEAFGRVPIVDFNPTKDVVMGRGGLAIHNPANKAWRKNVDSKKQTYKRQKKRADKTKISRKIVQRVYNIGGRFVTDEASVKNRFYLVPEAEAVKKTSQCLREMKKDRNRRHENQSMSP